MFYRRKLKSLLCWFQNAFLVGAALLLACFTAWASGITVPANSILDVNNGTLRVELSGNSGHITNAGTIMTATDGVIYLNGDWTTVGVGSYIAPGGSVFFTGTGTQIVIPGSVDADGFFNFVHTGSSSIQLNGFALDVNGDFTNSNGAFVTNDLDMSVAGNWVNTSTADPSFVAGIGMVTLDGDNQTVTGKSTFYDLAKQLTTAASRTLTLPAGLASEQVVQHSLTLKGYDLTRKLLIRSSASPAQAYLTLENGGAQDIRYVDVQDNNASRGTTLVGRNSISDTQNNTNWVFGSFTIKWTGSADTDWSNPFNWDLGLVPATGDTAIIRSVDSDATPDGNGDYPPIPNQPVLNGAATVGNLTIESGASVNLNMYNLTVEQATVNNGTVIIDGVSGSEILSTLSLTDNGTVKYVGLAYYGATVNMNQHVRVNGTYLTTFYNLIIDEDNIVTSRDTFTTTVNMAVTNDMTIVDGSVTTGTGITLTVGHDLSIAADSLAPKGTLTVSHDTTLSGGTLNITTTPVTFRSGNSLSITGGTLNGKDGSIDANHVTINLGTLSAPDEGGTFTVSGDFTFLDGVFTNNNGTVTLDATSTTLPTNQTIRGSNTFYNLTKQVPATAAADQSLTLAFGDSQVVTHALVLTGADATHQLLLRSSTANQAASLKLSTGGAQTIQNVDVKDSTAAGGVRLIDRGAWVNSGNNTNWSFGGADIIWTATVSSDWGVANNWDLGTVPQPGDNVFIPGGLAFPHLTALSGNVTVGSLTLVASNSGLYLDGHGLTVTGALSNEGTIHLQGGEALDIATPDINSGTFIYEGDADATSNPYTITAGTRPSAFYNLTIQDWNSSPDTFAIDEDITIYGSVAVYFSTFNASSNSVDVNGNFTVGMDAAPYTGTFIAPGAGHAFTIAGNISLINGNGIFTANGGTVTLDATSDETTAPADTNQTITGNFTFYNLSKTIASGKAREHRLTFDNASTQTITNLLTLQGLSGNDLVLRSNSPDDDPDAMRAWEIALQAGGLQDIRYVNVKDSDASSGLLLVGRDSVDSTNNTNWAFGVPTLTWTAGHGTTAWGDPYNWDLGFVPQVGDNVVIAPAAQQPDLVGYAGVVAPNNLTLQAGTTLTLSGENLTVQDTLFNDGTVILQGSEDVLILHQDTDSGAFEYQGDGDLTADPKTFTDGTRPAAFHDLIINSAVGTPDTFLVNKDLTINGTLTVTQGALSLGAQRMDVLGDITVAANGTLDAVTGQIDVNGAVAINGTLSAPGPNLVFNVGGNWTRDSAGILTTNNGQVTFDSTTAATVTGDTTFYDLAMSAPSGKDISFAGSSTQTISHALTINGGQTNRLILRSAVTSGNPGDAARQWTLDVPSLQVATNVDVQDSRATGAGASPYILAVNSIDRKDAGNVTTNPGWRFEDLYLMTPAEGSTIGTTPVLIGKGPASAAITVVDSRNGGTNQVASFTTDVNGNFRVTLASPLPLGADYLVPVYNGIRGAVNNVTVVAAPTPAQVPVVTSPTNNQHVNGENPDIIGQGKPGATVYVVLRDSDAGHTLTLPPVAYAGQGTVGADGTFSVPMTTPILRGTNYVSVIVDGVSSAVFTYLLSDIFGTVFDSATDNPIKGATVSLYKPDGTLAVPGTDISAISQNPRVTQEDGLFDFMATSGTFYIQVQESGYTYPTTLTNAQLPADRTVVTGSRKEQFTLGTQVLMIDQPMDVTQYLFKIVKDANKSEAKIGEVVTYTVTIESLSANNSIMSTRLYDILPAGFKFMNGRAQLDGMPMADPTGNRPLTFDVGTFTPQQKKTLRYQLVVGTGVAPGNYENTAYMKYDNGMVISNHSTETVKIVLDTLFDAGTVFGKVFYDLNENGKQDAPDYIYEDRQEVVEGPVAGVKIVMEDGTIVTADKNGQFHIPGLLPGRHVLRVDERSLPKGSYLTTDKAQIIDVTAGSTVKVNFGVNVDNTQIVGEDARFFREKIKVDQVKDQPVPRLNVDMFNSEILLYNDAVMEQIEFRIFMNYAPFIQTWRLDVLDKDTKRVVKSFNGTPYGIFSPILWDGRDSSGRYIRADRNYAYVVKVEDNKGGWSETKEKAIAIKVLTEEEKKVRDQEKTADEKKKEAEDLDKRYREWVMAQSKVDALENQTIFIQGETLVIDPQGIDVRSVRVLKDGENLADIPVPSRAQRTARDVLEGETAASSSIEMIVPNGDYELEVVTGEGVSNARRELAGSASSSTAPAASSTPVPGPGPASESITKVTNYREPIKVGEDYMMFVALGDGKVGYNVNKGNIEPVQGNEKFQPGFYKEGKMAYYLKGKVKGKYLVTSSFDTERKQKEMFRSVNDDDYYPVYGDSSTINYDATNTQGNLYLLVEWDKSQAVWGNYAVDLKNTEFANYTRTLYGGKVDYTSVASTPYGEPRTNIVMFNAEVRQRAAHNEMLGTGGSLYYLKNQDVVPGSLKVKLEVRDADTGLVLSTTDMSQGSDYDVDNSMGRVLFWQPVSMSADSGKIISNNLLSGNPVYVVADYEYEVKDKMAEATRGARVQQAVGKNVLVGSTYVSETQSGSNYELKGQDVTVHVGQGTTLKAEYAETSAQDSGSFVSTDGGITFTELAVGNSASGKAYGLSQDSRLFDRLGIKSYYKWIDSGFSTAGTTSQQGKQMTGLAMTFDLTPVTRLSASYDVQKLIEQGNLQTKMQVGAQETRTTVLQLVHEARRLRVTGEIRTQQVTGKDETYQSATNNAKNSYAFKAEYDVDEKTKLSVKQQVDANGVQQADAQATAEVTRQLTDKLSATVGETFGSQGTATKVGVAANVTPKITVATDYAIANSKSAAGNALTTTVTANEKIGDQTNIQAKYGVSQTGQGQKTLMVLGADTGVKVDDATIKAGVVAEGENQTFIKQGVTLGATKGDKEGHTTTSNVKVDESAKDGKTTTVTLADTGRLGPNSQLAAERSLTFGQETGEQLDTYKIVKAKDGKSTETAYTRKYAQTQSERSASNIYGLTGDINDKWAASASIEQGKVQNIDGSIYDRLAFSGGLGYLEKDENGQDKLKSSTKLEARIDQGTHDKQQFLVYQSLEGKVSDETTLSGKFEWSKTTDKDTGATEAQYKEIMLGGAYRPVAFDRLNMFAKYTYKENQKPEGQVDTSDVEQSKMHVLSADVAYDLTDEWQIVERLAYRMMEEKVAGFNFAKTHTWLLINRANYRIAPEWKVGAEYRVLTQQEAKDQKRGFLVEAVRNINDNVELGIGYNFTDFIDDLTNLDYSVQGPYIRMTGKFYDRTPEERARARQKWLDRRVERYAWKMVNNEFKRKDSPVVLELNQMYHMAQVAAQLGKYDESRQIYKDVILATQMMYEEAANFVRKHINFEEKLFNAYQRAKEYYDKGELWMARKLWEKIVEEAERSMLE